MIPMRKSVNSAARISRDAFVTIFDVRILSLVVLSIVSYIQFYQNLVSQVETKLSNKTHCET